MLSDVSINSAITAADLALRYREPEGSTAPAAS
jgi:hypothetical protein